MRRSVILFLCIVLGYSMAWASPANLQKRGEATFRWLGIPIYEARLFTPSGADLNWQDDFALELTYLRKISRDTLVESTLTEMQRIGANAPALARLANCYRDVTSGDRFQAITRGADEIRFQFNGLDVCTLTHPDIKAGFMAVFLGENTRSARFTRNLRGE